MADIKWDAIKNTADSVQIPPKRSSFMSNLQEALGLGVFNPNINQTAEDKIMEQVQLEQQQNFAQQLGEYVKDNFNKYNSAFNRELSPVEDKLANANNSSNSTLNTIADKVGYADWYNKKSNQQVMNNVHNNLGANLLKFAKENNIDPAILYTMAHIESSGDPEAGIAKNKRYVGAFQVDSRNIPRKDWANVDVGAKVALDLINTNKKVFASKFPNKPFDIGMMYLYHQQGAGGATALLKGADKGLTAVESLAPLYINNAKKLNMNPQDYVRKYVVESNGGKVKNGDISALDFVKKWTDKPRAIYQAYKEQKSHFFQSIKDANNVKFR